MSSTPTLHNKFWRYVRLREGREVFKTSFVLKHADGTPVTVTVEGANSAYVSALANGIKAKYMPQAPEAKPKDPEDHFGDLLDFFGFKR